MKFKHVSLVLGLVGLGVFFIRPTDNLGIDRSSKVTAIERLHKGEPGFGDDAFEVSRYRLAEPGVIKDFKNYDEGYQRSLDFHSGLIEIEMGEKRDKLYSDIDKIVAAGDSIYRSFDDGDEYKLYIYSPKLNQGYFIYVNL